MCYFASTPPCKSRLPPVLSPRMCPQMFALHHPPYYRLHPSPRCGPLADRPVDDGATPKRAIYVISASLSLRTMYLRSPLQSVPSSALTLDMPTVLRPACMRPPPFSAPAAPAGLRASYCFSTEKLPPRIMPIFPLISFPFVSRGNTNGDGITAEITDIAGLEDKQDAFPFRPSSRGDSADAPSPWHTYPQEVPRETVALRLSHHVLRALLNHRARTEGLCSCSALGFPLVVVEGEGSAARMVGNIRTARVGTGREGTMEMICVDWTIKLCFTRCVFPSSASLTLRLLLSLLRLFEVENLAPPQARTVPPVQLKQKLHNNEYWWDKQALREQELYGLLHRDS
ncbi:hypothetical protein H4582DRAFT_2056877 [Lactarius indigo]|nr:hypothetical protein H4582DRAFT_2056877 [Lactarius indigo]